MGAAVSSAPRCSRWPAQRPRRPSVLTGVSFPCMVLEVTVTRGNVKPGGPAMTTVIPPEQGTPPEQETAPGLESRSDRDRTAARLLRSSAEHSYDPEVEI